ncbi:unnamed protein product [Candidula unifasciata]|uniref:Methyltransferase-like protein 23 n=1 Tax=Candidula unifasciata TaxID=100452 RepID=A0A8S3ZHI1_9EUPU|nr:unnamed protein product [Candidula unifasciata]
MSSTVRQFEFHDTAAQQSLTVKIPEVTEANYGLYIWPCAPVLAQYVWLNRNTITGKHIIEIGAGTSLPGIVAAKCGAAVTLSDRSTFDNCLSVCRQSAHLNGLTDVSVIGLTWGQVTPALVSLPKVNIILASDCFYDTKDFENVIMTFSYLLHKNPEAEVWCCYQERSSERTVEYLMDKWQLCGQMVEIPSLETMTSSYSDHLRHVIQLFIIKLQTDKTV